MKYPKVELYTENKANFEAQYLCFLAKGISTGTYQDGGFLVLPTLFSNHPKTVHFPDFPYSKDFWRSLSFNPNINLSTLYPEKALKEASDFLNENKDPQIEDECLKLAKDWHKIESEFFETIDSFLDLKKALSKVSKIKVLITPYGTRGSFNPPRVGNEFNLMVTSRIDMPAGNIAAGILQNLYIIETRIGGEIGSENYLKRMATINFLFTKTAFKKFYPDFADLTKPDLSVPVDLLKRSEKYLEKLGFPGKKLVSLSEKGEVYLNGNYTNGTFSQQETGLIKALIENSGQILTFDQTADILWGEASDEKFSLEAMAKIVENVRRKIREKGVHKNLINTVRGKGYYLSN